MVATALLLSTSVFLRAEDGAGTTFFACRAEAHSTAVACWNGADGFWSKSKCWVSHELDLLGCDAQLMRDLKPF